MTSAPAGGTEQEERAEDARGPRGVAAVDRALRVLEAVERAEAPPSLAEIARASGLYKSTALRLLESLQDHGLVSRLGEARYALGPAAHRLGAAYARSDPLRAHVEPALARLVAAGTESPSFHVRQDAGRRVCLFRRDSDHATLDRVAVGDLLPLDRGAAGAVIRAWDPGPGERPEADPALARALARGWALSLGERDPSCAGLAAPVLGPGERLIGALSLSGPRDRFAEADLARMRPRLLEEAAALSAALGG